MNEIYTLNFLNQYGVSVSKQTYIEQDGVGYTTIDQPHRRAYSNSVRGRVAVETEIPQIQQNAIFAVWGDTPTVIEEEAI